MTRPQQGDEFDRLIASNVDAITKIEAAAHANRSRADVVADAIAGFCGSVAFLWTHIVAIGGWLLLNGVLAPKHLRFDPPPFSELNLWVSLEAIFLSTFILISQNRQQRLADQRNHLDLQINLLAEQESSQMLRMMRQIMEHMEMPVDAPKADVLEQATDPQAIAEHLERVINADES